MSSVLADTIARALPLFQHRWVERARSIGYNPEAFVTTPELVQEQEAFWAHLVDAVRSGDYRSLVTTPERETANLSRGPEIDRSHTHLARIVSAQAALMVECVQESFDGSPQELASLMREMAGVREIFVKAALGRADESLAPPAIGESASIVDAVDGAAGSVRVVTTFYAPGQAISSPDDPDRILYLVRSGRVRLFEALPDGRMITLSILGTGDVFGALCRLTDAGADPDGRRLIHAEAMTDTGVTLIHESDLQPLIAHAPEAARQIIASLSAQLRDLHVLIEQILARDTSVRLIAIILKLAEAFGEPISGGMTIINFPITHQDLANMTGSNRVTVTRKLLELQKDHVIVPERRNTIAVAIPQLRALMQSL